MKHAATHGGQVVAVTKSSVIKTLKNTPNEVMLTGREETKILQLLPESTEFRSVTLTLYTKYTTACC